VALDTESRLLLMAVTVGLIDKEEKEDDIQRDHASGLRDASVTNDRVTGREEQPIMETEETFLHSTWYFDNAMVCSLTRKGKSHSG
jgi:hypothetical protein